MQQFKCTCPGQCCTRIRGMISEEESNFMREYAYGRLPLVQLIPVEKTSFPLWDWEAARFNRWQNEVNVNARIIPSRGIYDTKSNSTIIVTFCMDFDSCPFLFDGGKCKIYYTKRAYVCRMYPFQRSPFLNVEQPAIPKNILGACPVTDEIIQNIPEEFNEMIKYFHIYFTSDGAFHNAVQHDIIIEWVNQVVMDLMKKKVIFPQMNYPYDYLMKRVSQSRKISLTDFLVDINAFSRGEMDKIIKGFDENTGAKDKIESYLNQIKKHNTENDNT